MLQPYFVKGLIGKVLAYGGLQIRKYIPHGLQPTNERRAESKLAYAMPSKEEEDKVKSLRTSLTLRSCRLSVAITCRQVTILSLSESGTLAYQKWHFRGAKVPLFVSQMRSNVC